MKKTKIEFFYRDACNFKVWNACGIDGTLSEEQKDIIMGCLDEGELFIPSMVGLPENKFGFENENDHPFFELARDGFIEVEESAGDIPNVNITPEELTAAVQKSKGRWWQPSTVTEWCSECEAEISMEWSVTDRGYKAFCPVCGKRLMLCDACQHRGPDGSYVEDCDYDSETNACRFNKKGKEEE